MPWLPNSQQNIVLGVDDVFTRDDWLEAVQNFAPGGGDVFSLENSEAVTVGYIPFFKRWSFIRYVLGTATIAYEDVEDYNSYYLSRTPPVEHPWFGWMQAHSIHLQYFAPNGAELKIEAFDPDLSFDFANYINVQATIRYRQLPWVWKAEADITYEYERMCFDPDRQGNLDILSQYAGQNLIFAETSATATASGLVAGATQFPTQLGLPIYKEAFNFKWMYVPKDYIMSSASADPTSTGPFAEGFNAKKITPRLATLNNASFLGFLPGTLILAGVSYERFLWPLRTEFDSAYGYNVIFHFQVFDPTKGKPNTPVGNSPFFGHNLMPWAGDGKFYYATLTGTTGGQPYLPSSDFTKLFDYVNAT